MAEEKIIFSIDIDLGALNTSIEELKKKQKELTKAFEGAKIGSDAYKALQKELLTTNAQIKTLSDSTKSGANALGGINKSAQFAVGSFGELRQRIKALKTEQDNLVVGSEEFIKNQHELSAALNEEIAIRSKQPSLFQERIKLAIDESKSLSQIKNEIKGLLVEQKKANKGSEEAIAIEEKLKVAREQEAKATHASGAALNSVTTILGSQTTQTSAIIGQTSQLGQTYKGLTEGIKTATKGFGGLKVAIAATGVGLLVIAFQTLLQYFTKTDEGAEKLERVMGAVGAVVDVVIGKVIEAGKFLVSVFENPKKAIQDFGNLIQSFLLDRFNLLIGGIKGIGESVRLIFAGEFKKGAEVAGQALLDINRGVNPVVIGVELIGKAAIGAANGIKKIAGEAELAANAAAEIVRQLQELDDVERELSVVNASREGEIARLIIAAKDRTKADQERVDLLIKAGEIEKTQSEESIDLAQTKLRLIRAENALKDQAGQLTDDLKDKEAAAQIEVIRLQNASIEVREKNANRINALQDEILADRQKKEKEALDARLKAEKEAQEASEKAAEEFAKRSEEEFKNTVDNLNNIAGERLLAAKDRLAEGLMSEEDYAEESFGIEQERLENLLTAYEDYGQDTMDIRQSIADNEIDQARRELKATQKAEKDKQAVREATLALAGDVFAGLADMAEDGSILQKGLAVTAATIDGIQATIKAYQAGLTLPAPAPAPMIFAVASAAATGAFAAANIAKIAKAEHGGIVWEKAENGKIFELGGNLHANGGTKFVGSDGTKFEAEKGEVLAVVNRKSSSMLKTLSELNVAGGGRNFYPSNHFADGGLVSQNLSNNALRQVSSLTPADIPQTVVSVKDIKKVNNKVTVIQSKKSL